MSDLLIRGCAVGERQGVDVLMRDGVVAAIGDQLPAGGVPTIGAGGGALVPGLHDHHLHVVALAAHLSSVPCGPESLTGIDALTRALRAAAARGDVRATGYHESVAGPLDRDVLDAMVGNRAVRVQHRSGAAWFLNSAALEVAGLAASDDPAVERDSTGRATGRLLRGDHLMRRSGTALPDLRPVGRLLAARGVTGITDATADLDPRQYAALREAGASGTLPQRLLALGLPLDDESARGVPWKIVLDESAGLDLDATAARVAESHRAGRPVAVHCVTLAESVVAVAALRAAGSLDGDRLEHGSVLPPALDADLARLGVTVVTQPNFVAERGDDYLKDVDAADLDDLYRCRTLLDAGIGVAAGTDAPYGEPDPWAAVAAAVTRRTRSGHVLGAAEALSPARALELFLGRADAPAGPPRRVEVGADADLCLLRAPLRGVLDEPSEQCVAATLIAGAVAYRADDPTG
jgi:predicted amidohydrolase YtcJ